MIKNFTISIIREARVDDNRTPLAPSQVLQLLNKYPNLNIEDCYLKTQIVYLRKINS